jgi:hypothetical protein
VIVGFIFTDLKSRYYYSSIKDLETYGFLSEGGIGTGAV